MNVFFQIEKPYILVQTTGFFNINDLESSSSRQEVVINKSLNKLLSQNLLKLWYWLWLQTNFALEGLRLHQARRQQHVSWHSATYVRSRGQKIDDGDDVMTNFHHMPNYLHRSSITLRRSQSFPYNSHFAIFFLLSSTKRKPFILKMHTILQHNKFSTCSSTSTMHSTSSSFSITYKNYCSIQVLYKQNKT